MDVGIYVQLMRELAVRKPSIFFSNGCWFCKFLTGNLSYPQGFGCTPADAYKNWRNKAEREVRIMAGGHA